MCGIIIELDRRRFYCDNQRFHFEYTAKGDKLAGKAKKKIKEKTDYFEVVFNTGEWLIMAFAVTLVFIVFVMQAYTIPTGSMADTLRGAHFRLRCRQCGYRYDHGFRPELYGYKTAVTPGKQFPVEPPRPNQQDLSEPKCPSCGYYMAPIKITRQGNNTHYQISADRLAVPSKGDRIFVLKCIYQFMDPKRWDVIVFKDPLNPKINYIKRLIGLPGESIELIDGDVYADGVIARKPANVQEELWMPVYDNDYIPIDPSADYSVTGAKQFNGKRWQQPFVKAEGSVSDLTVNGGRVFRLLGGVEDKIVYDTKIGNDFRATYAYDDSKWYSAMPVCSDVMIRFSVASIDSHGEVGAEISKYGINYRGWVDDLGQMIIGKVDAAGSVVELAKERTDWGAPEGLPHDFRFAVVDHQLVLNFDKAEARYDLGDGPDDAGVRSQEMPVVSVFGGGTGVELSHIGVFRDMYYTPVVEGGNRILRADEGDPFALDEDQYFVCGDNSPGSFDSRLWNEPGKGNNGNNYRMGIVPQDYLIGKAFFVYWPGGFQPWFQKGVRLVPHVGGVKLIAGGE